MSKYHYFLLLAFLAGSFPLSGIAAEPSATAATVQNLQRVTKQAERSTEQNRIMDSYYRYSRYQENLPQTTAPVTVEKEKTAGQPGEISFYVQEVKVSKSHYLSEEEIRQAVHFPGAGKLTIAQLQKMVDRLNALYAQKKIATAEAVLPPQTVKDGVVYIRLIEGTYGETRVEGNKKITDESILHRIHTPKGQLADLKKLEKDLLLYNATNTWQLSARLVPGKEEGTTDVELFLDEPENPVTTFLFADNTGQKDSGRYRIGAYSEYRGIGGRDASLAISPVWTEGIWGGSIAYDTPLGTRGTRANLSYSRNLVDIIDGPFQDFDLQANSNDLALTITHPLNVTPYSKVDFFVSGHRKWSQTDFSGMKLSDYLTRTLQAGFSARKFDKNGLWFGMASVTGYRSKNYVFGSRNDGSYYNAYLMRRQNFSGGRYLTARLYGQYTRFKELPSTEQFTLGGMATVRGYTESLLYGDKGWYAGLEYGFPLSKDLTTWRSFLFLDHGVAYNNYDVKTTRDFISSAGLGLEFNKNGWYAKVALGIPVNHSDEIKDEHPRLHFYLQRNI